MYQFKAGDMIAQRYPIISVLGSGRFSTVFLSQDTVLNRKLAIKVLHINISDTLARQRMEREGKVLSNLVHRNIVRVYHFGLLEDGWPYLALEYVEGETLRRLLEREKFLSFEHSLDIALQMCVALEFAHRCEIIHRDLKPENIVLTGDGDEVIVKVLDFGLCKLMNAEPGTTLTGTGALLGTPQYMDPQVILGKPCTYSTDIYAFGCIFYEIITGKTAFTSDNPALLVSMQVTSPFPGLPEDPERSPTALKLQRIISKCTSKGASGRYENFAEVLSDLQELDRRQATRYFASIRTGVRKPKRRVLHLVAFASAILLTACLSLAAFTDSGVCLVAQLLQSYVPARVASEVMPDFLGWLLRSRRTAVAVRIANDSISSAAFRGWNASERETLCTRFSKQLIKSGRRLEALDFSLGILARQLDELRHKSSGTYDGAPHYDESSQTDLEMLAETCRSISKMDIDEAGWQKISAVFEKHDAYIRKPIALLPVLILRTDALLKQKDRLDIRGRETLTELCKWTARLLATETAQPSDLELALHYRLEELALVRSHLSPVLSVQTEIETRVCLGLIYLQIRKYDLAGEQYRIVCNQMKETPSVPVNESALESLRIGCKAGEAQRR
jgi:tRNA A-37 threonylcarbamoyl transferase component Bud32